MPDRSREIRALRRAAQRGHDAAWAELHALAPADEEPFVLALLDDDDDNPKTTTTTTTTTTTPSPSARPRRDRSATVLAARDTAFMERLVAARRAHVKLDEPAWRALVATLRHPRVRSMRTTVARVRFLTSVLADQTHRDHTRLPRRLRELIATYATLRAAQQRPGLVCHGATAPPTSPRLCQTEPVARATTARDRTLLAELAALAAAEHMATLRAIERAGERHAAWLEKLLAAAGTHGAMALPPRA